jgi:uncharacterized protein (TIGR02996 family)
MTDLEALLRAVLLNPGELTVRLIYADELESQGRIKHAQFIRHQIATGEVFRGGIRDCVCTAAQWPKPWPLIERKWAGGGLVRNGFLEEIWMSRRHFVNSGGYFLFQDHPIREVWSSTNGPFPIDGELKKVFWSTSQIPKPIWKLMIAPYGNTNWKRYPNEKAALDELSRACVAYGRSKMMNAFNTVKPQSIS